MPLITGLHFLKTLLAPPQTIHTTAYREYAYEGFELNVLAYLLKPFSYERFPKAGARYQPLATAPAADEQHLLLKEQGSLLKVPYRDIVYVQGCKDYVKVVTATKIYLHYETMKGMAELLGAQFVRAHRSFIVAAAHLKLLQPEQLVLTTGEETPVGSSHKTYLLVFFKN